MAVLRFPVIFAGAQNETFFKCDKFRRIYWPSEMQTNREDCGKRHREIILPEPPNRKWARTKSADFRNYFQALSEAGDRFRRGVSNRRFNYIVSVLGGNSFDDGNGEPSDETAESVADET